MKKMILLAVAAAGIFTLASSVQAAEVFLSPRAQANQITHVKGINNEPNLVSGWYAGAATRIFTTQHSMVASGPVLDVNLVSGNYLGAASKSPHRDLRGWEYQIAPLIEKRNKALK